MDRIDVPGRGNQRMGTGGTIGLGRREREWLERRGEIIAASAALFAESGYSGTTMQSIADKADFSVGYLYRHFESKRAIVEELIDRELERYEEVIESALAENLSPLRTYRMILEGLSSQLSDRRALVRVMSRDSLLSRLPERNSRLQKYRLLDEELMRRAWEAGEIHRVDFELLAAVLRGVLETLMLDLSASDDPRAMERIPDIMFEYVVGPLTRNPAVRSGPGAAGPQ